jgi:subtilisin family serine protease
MDAFIVPPDAELLRDEHTTRLHTYADGKVLVETAGPLPETGSGAAQPVARGLRLATGSPADLAMARQRLDAAPLAAAAPAPEADQARDLLAYVELVGPVAPEWLSELEALRIELLRYQPENCYLCRASLDAFRQAREQPFVLRVTPLSDVLKPAPETTSEERSDVWIVATATREEADGVVAQLGAMEGVEVHPAEVEAISIHLRIPATVTPEGLSRVLGHPQVLAAEPRVGAVPEDEVAGLILAGRYDAGGVPGGSYLGWLEDHGLNGQGVTIGIVDNGVDEDHPAFTGRITALDSGKKKWHGTFVAGHAAGRYLVRKDEQGFVYGLGTAPAAELLVQDSSRTPAALCAETVRETGPSGVAGTIQNNSWGMGLQDPMDYGSLEAAYDAMVRNADPDGPEPRPLTICFSSGNAGASGLTRPKAAKNIIVTGNSENYRPRVGYDESDDIDQVYTGSHASSWGNCGDRRVRPDVVAPGEWTASANYDSRSGQREYIDDQLTWGGGSSGASPKTAGACALLTQWWRRHNAGADPSPAMLRALIVNAAVDTGHGGPAPNPRQGWGRLNLQGVVAEDVARVQVDQAVMLTTRGDERSWWIRVSDPAKPFKVTLAWTDPPGPVGSGTSSVPVIVNRLGLRVEFDGRVYHGNHFADGSGWSAPGPLPDPAREGWDNLQNVSLPPGVVTGRVKVTVAALNVTTDCLTGRPNPPRQDFALVVRNGSDQAGTPADVAVVVDDAGGEPAGHPDGYWADQPGEADADELDADWWWEAEAAANGGDGAAVWAGTRPAAAVNGGPAAAARLADDPSFLRGLKAGGLLLGAHAIGRVVLVGPDPEGPGDDPAVVAIEPRALRDDPARLAAALQTPLRTCLARLSAQWGEPMASKAAVVVVGAGSRFTRQDLAAFRRLAFTGRLYLVSDSPGVLAFLAQRIGRRVGVQFRAAPGRSHLPATIRDVLAEAGGGQQAEPSSRFRTVEGMRYSAHAFDLTEADHRLVVAVDWPGDRAAPEVKLARPGRPPVTIDPDAAGGDLQVAAWKGHLQLVADRQPGAGDAWVGRWELQLRQRGGAGDQDPEVAVWLSSDLVFRLDRKRMPAAEAGLDGGDEELVSLGADGATFSRLRLDGNVIAGQATSEAAPAEVTRVPSRLETEAVDAGDAPGPEAAAGDVTTPSIAAPTQAPRPSDGPGVVELVLKAAGTSAGGARFERRLRASVVELESRAAWRRRAGRRAGFTPAQVVRVRYRDGAVAGLLLRHGTSQRYVTVASEALGSQLAGVDLAAGDLHFGVNDSKLLAVIQPMPDEPDQRSDASHLGGLVDLDC